MHFVQMRHDLEKLGPNDKIREPKEQAAKEGA
jgi:mediator of RNA polymerase II transcription subunit 21